MVSTPTLSVVTVTYNHEQYISRALDSFLSQETTFPIEIIIADDCSCDRTVEICREYKNRYPGIIRLLTTETNLGAVKNERRAIESARGTYIATCEGDDFWIDTLKLQKQVSFLETHADFSVCFHRYYKYYSNNNEYTDDGNAYLFSESSCEGIEINMNQFMHRWCTQYLTMVFRRDCYDSSLPERYKYYRDTHQVYHLLLKGRCYVFSFVGGVYNITNTGIYSTSSQINQNKQILAVDRELWIRNRDDRWKEMCCVVMQDMIDRFHALYAFRVFLLNGNIIMLLKNISRIIHNYFLLLAVL